MWNKLRKRPIKASNITKLKRKMREAAEVRKSVRFDSVVASKYSEEASEQSREAAGK